MPAHLQAKGDGSDVSLIIIWALGAVRDLADLGLSHSILERDRGIGLIAHQDLAVGEDDVVGAGLEKRRQPVGEIAGRPVRRVAGGGGERTGDLAAPEGGPTG
jgi:hypothetical protein